MKSAVGPRGADGYANGRARRRDIVQAAADHFEVSGFNGATIRDIARAVGISRAGLMRHFETKELLLQAVLEQRDMLDRNHFRRYAGVSGGVGILRGMIDLAEQNEKTPGMVNLFIRLSTEASDKTHPAHHYFCERYAAIRSGTAQTLHAAADAGFLQPNIDPTTASVLLTATMDGLQVQWMLEPALDMHQHVRIAIERLLTPAGIAALERVRPKPLASIGSATASASAHGAL